MSKYSRQEIEWKSFRKVVEMGGYRILCVYIQKISGIVDVALRGEDRKNFYSVKFILTSTKKKRVPFIIAIPESYIVPISDDISTSLFTSDEEGHPRGSDFDVQFINLHSRIDIGSNIDISSDVGGNLMSGDFNVQIAYAKDLWSKISAGIGSITEGSGLLVMGVSSIVVIFRSKPSEDIYTSEHKMFVYHLAEKTDLLNEHIDSTSTMLSSVLNQNTDDVVAENKRINRLEESILQIQKLIPDRDTMDKHRTSLILEGRQNPNLTINPTSGAKSELLDKVPDGATIIAGGDDTDDILVLDDDDDDSILPILGFDPVARGVGDSIAQQEDGLEESQPIIKTSLFEDVPDEEFSKRYTFPDVLSSETFSQVITENSSHISVSIGVTYVVCSALMFFKERLPKDLPPGEIIEQRELQLRDTENILLKNKVKMLKKNIVNLSKTLDTIFETYISEDNHVTRNLRRLAKIHSHYKGSIAGSSKSKKNKNELLAEGEGEDMELGLGECEDLIDELNIKRVENKNKLATNIYELATLVSSINFME